MYSMYALPRVYCTVNGWNTGLSMGSPFTYVTVLVHTYIHTMPNAQMMVIWSELPAYLDRIRVHK